MIKLAMLATVAAGLFMGANTAGSIPQVKKAPLDTRIIVECDRSLATLTDEGVKNVQNSLLNRIRSEVTSNVKLISSYSTLNNAIAIAVNSQYVDQITNLSGVKSVTKDEIHWVRSNDEARAIEVDPATDYGGKKNISAETMNKPVDTNDGEGTLIAILDNEFYFRGKHKEKNDEGKEVEKEAWWHETFTSFEDLGESPVVRFKPVVSSAGGQTVYKPPKEFSNAKNAYKKINKNAYCGEEGSLYFNSKVPFYFDYGGEIDTYGSDDFYPDLDVHSDSSYHGSHVASIASGHSEFYSGIAPKAQLLCMKVFTEFKSSSFTDSLGLGSFSGAYDIPILNALEDCIDLGVDGINMSLGSNLDDFDSDSITLKTLTRLSDSGILSAIAAGNAGKTSYASLGGYANWTSDMVETGIISSYVNNHSTTSVAAAQPTEIFYTQAIKVGDSFVAYEDQVTNREGMPKDFKVEHFFKDLFEETPSLGWQYVPGFGTSADYTDIDVRNKVAVVNRGSISFTDKYTEALAHGAKALAFINNDPTSSDFNFHCSFGGEQPEIPVILVLFKDKGVFDGTLGDKKGTLSLIKDELHVNEKAKTASSFSSDGIAFDLEIKPDISSPGDLIRGAVPPQNKDDRASRPYTSYAFLSGTSMAAPNYAGAQSVMLSKKAKDTYTPKSPSATAIAEYKAYRNTVDMRLLSTADPMLDYEVSPESGVKTLTSPRIQGAGLVDLGGAYRTDVYLEGADYYGEKTGKAKISLRNYDAINNGRIEFSFYSHNESEEERLYDAYLTLMRPAIKNDNSVVTKDYNERGEIDDITLWSGRKYFVKQVSDTGEVSYVEKTAAGKYADKDVFKVSREIPYYSTAADIENATYDEDHGTWSCSNCGKLHIIPGTEVILDKEYCPECHEDRDHHTEDFYTKIAAGKYTYDKASDSWIILPGYDYQSTQDVYIEEKLPLGEVAFAKGEQKHNFKDIYEYSLSTSQKEDILNFYESGCYLEGYITFESKQGKEDLNLVYVGFFGGGEKSYQDAPVVEPFNFEKSASKVYQSDLVNDVTKTLIGKQDVDYGSTWIAGYLESGTSYDLDAIRLNEKSLSSLAKNSDEWHFLGEDPFSGELYEDASKNLYVGNPYSSNTMIIQQFVLRSVADNYFVIKNHETGEIVYKSCMVDAIHQYGYMNKWPLYKSHVNGDMLSSYTADKALAVVPLFDSETGEPFPDGQYDITFKYLLAGTNTWTSDTDERYNYSLIIDSTAPKVTKVTHIPVNEDEDGEGKVRFDVAEANLAYAAVGSSLYDVKTDAEGNKYIEFTEDELTAIIENNPNDATDGTGRLFISLVDKAFGETGVIVRFKYVFRDDAYDFDNYVMGQHAKLKITNDLIDRGLTVAIVDVVGGVMTEVEDQDIVKFTEIVRNGEIVEHIAYIPVTTGGCGGNIATTSVTLSTLALSAIVLLAIAKIRKKKKVGGN